MKRLRGHRGAIFLLPLGCVLLPLGAAGWLIFALLMLVRHPFTRRRQEKRLRALAHRLGFDLGMTTVRTNFTGGEMATPRLDIISVRHGSPNDAIQAVVAMMGESGYVELTGVRVDASGD